MSHIFHEKLAAGFFIGNVADRLGRIAQQAEVQSFICASLDEVVRSAVQYAMEHKISYVLFSPGAASFDMFKNVYDRIEQFEKIVAAL